VEPTSPASAPHEPSLPIGRAGRLEAVALEVGGDHAVLVRETEPDRRARTLLTTDKLATGERLVVMPLDHDVEVRVDGDALAVWLGAGSMAQLPREQRPMPATRVPLWASVVGGGLLLLVLVFAVIGSAVVWTLLVALLT
jgi:hypothetical protein